MKLNYIDANKILVLGLWHQGIVGAACLSKMGYSVTGADLDKNVVENLKKAKTPIYEKNLKNLIKEGFKSKKLSFTYNIKESVIDKKFIFLMHDTPIDENDKVNLSSIYRTVEMIIPHMMEETIMCVTAQVPVGTCDQIEKMVLKKRPNLNFGIAYIPENLRLGEAIDRFYNPPMPVIGVNKKYVFNELKKILSFEKIEWIESNIKTAEMSKHALNTFLATSITFANELGSICDVVGADGVELAKILKLEPRIGSKAMLLPGLGFSGGTLARDTQILINIGKERKIETHFLDGLWNANIKHNQIVKNMLIKDFKDLENLKICVLGLTYKPNTSTLRRSISITTIKELSSNGAFINAYDPMVDEIEIKKYKMLSFFDDIYEAVKNTEIIVIMTGWEEFKYLDFKLIKSLMIGNYILDTNNMLDLKKMTDLGFVYKCIGRGK